MKLRIAAVCSIFTAAAVMTVAAAPQATDTSVQGRYVEARSCDVYTGFCFANSEMGLVGREAIMAWNVTEGAWNGVTLDGLCIAAVIKADETLGFVNEVSRGTRAALIVDKAATADQREALINMATTLGGKLLADVCSITDASFEAELGTCDKTGACARLKAGDVLEIQTRCIGNGDHVCGNEDVFYPPLTSVDGAVAGYTSLASYKGDALGARWSDTGSRSAFIATFQHNQ